MASHIGAAARLHAKRKWRSFAVDSTPPLSVDLAVGGGGPAGIAAAVSSAQSGRSVVLVDDNPEPGGQIWRQGANASRPQDAVCWLERLAKARARVMGGARVFQARRGVLEVETDQSFSEIHHEKLILATG